MKHAHSRHLHLMLTVLVFLGSARAADATYMYDLSVTGGFSGSGHIAFETLSGTSVAGVESFSFDPTSPGGFSFGVTDIATISWDFGLIESLNLTADTGAAQLSLLWFPLLPPFFSATLTPAGSTQLDGQVSVVAIPGPGTAWIAFLGSLAVVAGVARRRRRGRHGRTADITA